MLQRRRRCQAALTGRTPGLTVATRLGIHMTVLNGSSPRPVHAALVVGVDVGGTFTDIVIAAPDGTRVSRKVSTTPPEFEKGIIAGITAALGDLGPLAGLGVSRIAHGTTVATNAILEGRGAVTALVTTTGFRDVLEIGRLRRPSLFDIGYRKPVPLVPRNRRLEINERTASSGDVLHAPTDRELAALITELSASGADSVGVCLINSYRNPANERLVADRIRRNLPHLNVTGSCDLLPELKEYERTSTTVVNAYIGPAVEEYIDRLREELRDLGVTCDVEVMQSNGALLGSLAARSHPVKLVESGPAAGVIAAQALASRLGQSNVIAFDMGGTTAKASLIEDGRPFETAEYEVGGGMNQSGAFMQGGGYTIRVPALDIAEVGSGGGSIFWIDDGGAPRVGPRSAGAVPGPIAYGLGGQEVTVTDANLVLGYLNPEGIAGGTRALDLTAAHEAVQRLVATPLRLDILEAAYGVHTLANTNMGQAIRGVSIERGRDPRRFPMIAFGGAGPMHAALLADQFEVDTVTIPAGSGVFSALGLQVADMRHDHVVSYPVPSAPDARTMTQMFMSLEEQAVQRFESADLDGASSSVRIQRFVDQRYQGQAHSLAVSIGSSSQISDEDIATAALTFHQAHLTTYGYSSEDEVVHFISLRIVASVEMEKVEVFGPMLDPGPESSARSRQAYFGPAQGSMETRILCRSEIPETFIPGPVIVEDMDTTVVVPPDWDVARGRVESIIMRKRGSELR